MNVFETLKASVNTREAAEHYGIEVNRRSMALCPFHDDRNPSMLVADDHYHCFACGEHGDSIDLVARLYDLPPYEAALKLASDFGIATDKPIPKDIQDKQRKKNEAQKLRKNERLCFSLLNEYCKLLQHWKSAYTPESPDDERDDRFIEACHQLDYVEYLLDLLTAGDSYERAGVVRMMLRDNQLKKLQEHLKNHRKDNAYEQNER